MVLFMAPIDSLTVYSVKLITRIMNQSIKTESN